MIYVIVARVTPGGSSFVINKCPGETHYREEEREQAFADARTLKANGRWAEVAVAVYEETHRRTTLSGYVRTIPVE
jgi:hypothetical protein